MPGRDRYVLPVARASQVRFRQSASERTTTMTVDRAAQRRRPPARLSRAGGQMRALPSNETGGSTRKSFIDVRSRLNGQLGALRTGQPVAAADRLK